jgi:hypothetical protein
VVKIAPFVFSALIMVAVSMYYVLPMGGAYLLDQMVYVSPFVVTTFVLLSYSLKLCVWHRIECVLPLVPMFISLYDDYVSELSCTVVYADIAAVVIIFLLSLLNAYKLFLK